MKTIVGTMLCLSFMITACENRNTEVQREKEELKQEIEALQDRVNVRLNELGMTIGTASGEISIEIQQQMSELESASRRLAMKLEELEAETAGNWQTLKVDIRRTIDDLERQLDDIGEDR
jgi:hypothetical protein